MGFFDLFKRRSTQPDAPAPRTLPKPGRVNLSEHEVHEKHFMRLPEWSTFTPAPPVWQLPDLAEQERWVHDRIAAHAAAGALDGLVPDLLDRLIHHLLDETRTLVDGAHEEATFQHQMLLEQAKRAQVEAAREVGDRRNRLTTAEEGYAAAYETLTGTKPATKAAPAVVESMVVPTQIAPLEPLAPEDAPAPDGPVPPTPKLPTDDDDHPRIQLAR